MGGAVSAISISLAYVADLLMPAHRYKFHPDIIIPEL